MHNEIVNLKKKQDTPSLQVNQNDIKRRRGRPSLMIVQTCIDATTSTCTPPSCGRWCTTQSMNSNYYRQTTQVGNRVSKNRGAGISKDNIDHGNPTFPCESCGALLWHAETLRRATDALDEAYSICCSRGKVKLGTELKQPPKLLKDLITNEHNK
ncbi:hypothetical protein Tco_1549759, partial [Tanacetum coccineum]